MWEELYRTHYRELLMYCTGACRDRTLAEDTVQETFVKALQNAQLFEELGRSQRRAWLYRTARNLLCDRYRRSNLEQRYETAAEREPMGEETGFQSVENALLLAQLSPEDKALFSLRYLEDYSAAELAEALHIPAGTVRARLSRIRQKLKRMLK